MGNLLYKQETGLATTVHQTPEMHLEFFTVLGTRVQLSDLDLKIFSRSRNPVCQL